MKTPHSFEITGEDKKLGQIKYIIYGPNDKEVKGVRSSTLEETKKALTDLVKSQNERWNNIYKRHAISYKGSK